MAYQRGSPPEPKARGRGDMVMDRDGFIQFVQWTFDERKTKRSKVVIHSRRAKITAYLHWNDHSVQLAM